MRLPEVFHRDLFSLPAGPHTAMEPSAGAALQQMICQDGWLHPGIVSGGQLHDRRQIMRAARVQAQRRGLRALLLTSRWRDPANGLPCYSYDPFRHHRSDETAFLLSQTARYRDRFEASEIEFSLNALLRGWQGDGLREFAAASCEQLELQAQQNGSLPFAERAEFRRVYSLMSALQHLPYIPAPGASLTGLVRAGDGQILLPHPMLWAMALKEAEQLPGALVICEDAPLGELPGFVRTLLRGRTLFVGADLPAALPADEWETLCAGAHLCVIFAHPDALSAKKAADFYGEEYACVQEENHSTAVSWLMPWNRTQTRGTSTRQIRRHQILPETIQNLGPGQAVVSCGGARAVCTFCCAGT